MSPLHDRWEKYVDKMLRMLKEGKNVEQIKEFLEGKGEIV